MLTGGSLTGPKWGEAPAAPGAAVTMLRTQDFPVAHVTGRPEPGRFLATVASLPPTFLGGFVDGLSGFDIKPTLLVTETIRCGRVTFS